MNLFLPERRAFQPRSSALLTDPRLRLAFLGSLPNSDGVGNALTWTSSNPTVSVSPTGLNAEGNGSRYVTHTPSKVLDASKGFTGLAIIRSRSSSDYLNADGTCALLGNYNGGAGFSWYRTGAAGGSGSGNVTSMGFLLYGTAAYTETTPDVPSQVDTVVGVIYNPTANTVRFYHGPMRKFSFIEEKATGTYNVSSQTTQLFANGQNGIVWLDRVSLLLAWSQALTESELLSIGNNPFRVFATPSARIFSFPSAAPGGSSGPVFYHHRVMQGMS